MTTHTPSPQSVVVPVSAIVGFDVEEYVGGYEFRGDEGGYMPTDKERELITDAIHGVMSELSCLSAPAPAGGEVEKALDEALIYIEQLGANIERNDVDMHLDTIERPFSFAQTMRGRFPSLCAALSPEAPAREGVDWFGVTGAADETEALAVALFDVRCPGIRMTDEDLHYYRAAAQRAMQAVVDELDTPALTPRHEAPASEGDA